MTTRVRRSFTVDASVDDVWAFLSDAENRANAISVVDSVELRGEVAVWQVQLPVVDATIAVETRDLERDPPRHVKFTGEAVGMSVTGEHWLEPARNGCRVDTELVLDATLPGVESYFSRQLDGELDNLRDALKAFLAG